MKLRYLPNILSGLRIVLALCFPVAYFAFYPDVKFAMAVFLAAGVTDIADGFLARTFGWISEPGKVLDPIADKLMQTVVLVSLSVKRIVPVWLASVYIVKEICMLLGAFLVFRFDRVVAVSCWAGKLSGFVFYCSMFTLAVFGELMSPSVRLIICIFTILTALLAISVYFPVFADSVKNRKKRTDSDKSGQKA